MAEDVAEIAIEEMAVAEIAEEVEEVKINLLQTMEEDVVEMTAATTDLEDDQEGNNNNSVNIT